MSMIGQRDEADSFERHTETRPRDMYLTGDFFNINTAPTGLVVTARSDMSGHAWLAVQDSIGQEIIRVAKDGTITILPACTLEQWFTYAADVYRAARDTCR